MADLTPLEQVGPYWVKRDDLFEKAGMRGGKVRTCWHLSEGAKGLVTAGSRSSPQVNIVAHIAAARGIGCSLHVPVGELGPELLDAYNQVGAEVQQHYPGWNSNIIAKAKLDARLRRWRYIPFGMECREAITQTASQVTNLPAGIKRLVVPVGSGMSLAGIVHGLKALHSPLPVLGVVVGADPMARLNRYCWGWQKSVTLIRTTLKYEEPAPWLNEWQGIKLDNIYEAKCIPFIKEGDLFWIVGIRNR